jgi:hypothetical protein
MIDHVTPVEKRVFDKYNKQHAGTNANVNAIRFNMRI